MMNLDVAVRLVDETTRPAKNATAALDKFGNTANKLASRLAAPTRAIRGLAGALQTVKAADGAATTATASTGRLRGTMASLGPAARNAARGIDGTSRSLGRMTTAADRAERATTRLHGALGATMPATGFLAGAEAQLRNVVALQRQAIAGMRSLNAGAGGAGGRGGRRGMGIGHGGGMLPGLMVGLQPGGHETLRGVFEQATSLQDAIVRMHLNGLSDSEIAAVRAKAEEVAKLNKSTTPLSNINSIMEARLALGGDLNEALTTAGEISKMRTILGFSLGKDRAKAAEDATYDALRTAEVRNVVGDPARRSALFKGMTAAAIASNGRITPKQWHSTAIYGRSATQGLGDDFQNYRLPFLVQELANGGKGGPAGTALQAMFRAIPMAIQKSTNVAAWRGIGMLNEDKVAHGPFGEKMLPGAIKDDKLAMSDPDKFVYELMDRIAKRDKLTDIAGKDRGAMIQALAQFFGTATAQSAVDIMGLQRGRMDNFERTLRQVEDSDTLFAQINETASQSVANLNAQFDQLKGNIGSSVIPAFTSLVDGTRQFLGVMNGAARVGGGNGNDPVNGKGGGVDLGQLALLAGGAFMGLGKLASTRPWLARLLAGGAGAAATGSPAGALLGPAIVSAGTRLAGMLPGAVRSGLTAGIRGGIIGGLALEGGKALISGALSFLPKPQLSPQNQARADAMGREREGTWFWEQPRELFRIFSHGRVGDYMPGGSRYGQPMPEDLRRFAPPGSGVPIAGARALGGPVGSGKSYLVGEHGPEIFTPGMSGAISTHTATRLALTHGDAGGGSDDGTAREVRYLSFALAGAVDGVARSIDRLGRGRVSGDGSDGGSGIGGGGGVGDAGGGRRGFMARGGHFGPGAAAPDVVPGGPRVGPVTATGGMKGRGMTAAKLAAASESFNFWRSKGATHAQAAAMVANEETESGFNPRAIGDGGTAHGIMQWHGDRRRNIMRGVGIDIDHANHLQQLEAAYWEMTKGNERDGGRRFFAARNEHDAVDALVNHYERPADRRGNVVGRTAGALRWASRFGEGKPMDPGPKVPDALVDRARRQGERDRAADAARSKAGGERPTVHVGAIHVHAQPHHDERQIAEMVHRRFSDAVHSQLNDGAFA